MNHLNYGSLGASKRLVEAGIVLETEAVWISLLIWVRKEASNDHT